MKLPEHKPRRPYDEETYPGYLEGDNDYFDNNRELAIALLDAYAEGRCQVAPPPEELA
jgi:hypothetical protein